MKKTAYTATKIFTGDTWVEEQALLVQDGIIEKIIPLAQIDEAVYEVKQFNDAFIAPAFIDIQIYGAHEKLLAVHPTIDALQALHDYCLKGGATLCVPTVATNTFDVFYQCIDAVKRYWAAGGKGIHGLHLEGPWINAEKRGAHIAQYIHEPTLEKVKTLLEYGKGVIKIITLAPEVCPDEVIKYIQSENIIISAGHSNATYTQATAAFNNGITTATHLYNAMSPLQHRAPGMVGAIFNHSSVRCSVIPDGYHVDYAAIAIAKEIMRERLFAITDAVTTTTSAPYPHQLAGDKYESGGILSGSALTMHKAFKNLVQQAGIPVEEALRMCSLYAAQVIGVENKQGKLLPGNRAEAIVLNNQFDLVQVINA